MQANHAGSALRTEKRRFVHSTLVFPHIFGSEGAEGFSHGWSEAKSIDNGIVDPCPGRGRESFVRGWSFLCPSGAMNWAPFFHGLRFASPVAIFLGCSGAECGATPQEL